MDEKITSRENAKVKYACRLASSAAFRRTEGRFLAEGRKLCPELCRGAELETLFYTENALEKCPELAALPGEHYLVEDHVADKLADVGTHQGVFGVFRTPVHTLEEVRPGGRYLALERVQDPGNVGTLLRSAAAFGFDGVILSEGCASVYAPKTLRASMGAAVRIPVIETGAMPQAIALLRVLNMAKVRHLSAVIGLAEEEGVEAFFSALESGLTAETQKKDRTTMPGMSENPFDKVFLVPPAGTDAAMTERLLEKARYHFDAELCGSLAEAVELARANSRRGLLICGGEAIALEAADLLAEK